MRSASGRPSSPRGPAPPAGEIFFYLLFVLSNKMAKGEFVFPAKGPKVLPCIIIRNSSIGNPPMVGYHTSQ
uniref:VTE2-1 n=1 Tax=Arundo donax TaxID=35708 RepID=A0A0A9G4U2_ARUDO